jgi:hypothetical protein
MLTDTALRDLKPKSKIYKVFDRDGMYAAVSCKLRLGPLAQDREHQADLRVPTSLKADLDRYAALHVQTYGEAVAAR